MEGCVSVTRLALADAAGGPLGALDVALYGARQLRAPNASDPLYPSYAGRINKVITKLQRYSRAHYLSGNYKKIFRAQKILKS